MTSLDNIHKVGQTRAFPGWALAVGACVTVAAITLLGGNVVTHLSAYKDKVEHYNRLDDLQQTVEHLDDLTAMSVRLAVSTNEPSWEQSYHRQRGQRNAIIYQSKGAFTSAIIQTFRTNARLRFMEDRAFNLLRQSRRSDAQALIFGREYEEQLKRYRQNVDTSMVQLRKGASDLVDDARYRTYAAGGISLATIVALIAAWVGLVRLVKRHLAARLEAEAALCIAHLGLEEQIERRTSDLVDTNRKLKDEIERRKTAESQLEHGTLHDELTDLPNRSLLIDRLTRCVERAKRTPGYMLAVLMLDLDEFKVINDSFGHTGGDKLLIMASERLQNSLRTLDTVSRDTEEASLDTMGRTGGDEFVLILEDIHGIADAVLVAERIKENLALPFIIDGKEIVTTTSIGISTSQSGSAEPDELLRDADTALHLAKKQGKARHVVFNHDMHLRAVERLEVEGDLRNAIDSEQLCLYYQPIVSLQTGIIEGFEALVRWNHPDRGLVMPDDFIPVAEETGLIIPMGRWILHSGCEQLLAWRQRFAHCQELTMSINMSIRQFNDPDMLEHIDLVLEKTGLPASQLKLEITESLLMEDTQATDHLVAQLKARQLDLHLDDFGTGYSSLSYLHKLPIDALKIDRSFVANMGANGSNASTVAAVVTLAHNQGITVIAEGIETAEQAAKLRSLKCNLGQGYYFAKPLTALDAERLLSSGQRMLQSA
jgi:diguanylate cyclase (GGDEF)-like protein